MIDQARFLDALRFAASAAALKDIRYYLNGVLFEVRPDRLMLVGTDGDRIAVIEMVAEIGDSHADVIVSGADVKMLLSVITRENLPGLEIALIEGGLAVTDRSGRNWPLKGIDGKYPEWRRFPLSDKLEAVEAIIINSKYIAEAAKACDKLSNDKHNVCRMSFRGASSLVKFEPASHDYQQAYVAVMPMRL